MFSNLSSKCKRNSRRIHITSTSPEHLTSTTTDEPATPHSNHTNRLAFCHDVTLDIITHRWVISVGRGPDNKTQVKLRSPPHTCRELMDPSNPKEHTDRQRPFEAKRLTSSHDQATQSPSDGGATMRHLPHQSTHQPTDDITTFGCSTTQPKILTQLDQSAIDTTLNLEKKL